MPAKPEPDPAHPKEPANDGFPKEKDVSKPPPDSDVRSRANKTED